MRLHAQPSTDKVRSHPTASARGGFTLTEILVVIAIIALLAGMSAWAAVGMIANRQRSNTQATMRVLNKLLMTRWAAVVADAKKETPPSLSENNFFMPFANNDAEVAKVLWIKVRLVEAFPMRYFETTTNPSTVVNTYIPTNRRKPYFAKYQQTLGPLAPTDGSPGPPGESAACLLQILKSLQADGVTVDDQVKYAIAPTDYGPNANGTPYVGSVNNINTLIDGFGVPLSFQRFFIGAPNPAYPDPTLPMPKSRNAKFGDTTDSEGRLIVPVANWFSKNGRLFQTNLSFHQITPDGGGRAYYVIPMISSRGRDGKDAPSGGPDPNNYTQDNIYSFNLGVE